MVVWRRSRVMEETLDKYERKVRVNQIISLIDKGEYGEALEIADTIDWRTEKSIKTLRVVSEVYKINRRYEDAFKAFMKISKSSSYAQTFLGIMYERGQGVQKNDVYASEWYDKAVAKGSVDARYLEAQLYMNSKTLPDELKSQVLPLLTENACHGHRESVMFLATTYYPSSGNSEMGYGWLLYGARDLGMTDAASMVSKLQISRDYLEKAYEYAKNTCGQ